MIKYDYTLLIKRYRYGEIIETIANTNHQIILWQDNNGHQMARQKHMNESNEKEIQLSTTIQGTQ